MSKTRVCYQTSTALMLGMRSIGACIGEVDGPDDAGDTAANDGTGAVEQALTPAGIVDYTFTVCTCNVPDAGTDANIWTFLTGLNNGGSGRSATADA